MNRTRTAVSSSNESQLGRTTMLERREYGILVVTDNSRLRESD